MQAHALLPNNGCINTPPTPATFSINLVEYPEQNDNMKKKNLASDSFHEARAQKFQVLLHPAARLMDCQRDLLPQNKLPAAFSKDHQRGQPIRVSKLQQPCPIPEIWAFVSKEARFCLDLSSAFT